MNKCKLWGTLLVVMGLFLLLAAGGLYLMNEHQDEMAGETAGILLEQLQFNDQFGLVLNEQPAPVTTPETPENPEIQSEQDPSAVPEEELVQPMPTKTIAGYDMVGILRISSVGLELPILDQWNYNLLKISPCRYSGTVAENDLILMGHNYRSHFKPLYQVQIGDKVEFEDVNGTCYAYVVSRIDTLKGSEAEKLPSGHALSLFTCTPGGQSRLVLRCDRIPIEETPVQ